MVEQASTKRSLVLLPGLRRQSSIFKAHMKETTGFHLLPRIYEFPGRAGLAVTKDTALCEASTFSAHKLAPVNVIADRTPGVVFSGRGASVTSVRLRSRQIAVQRAQADDLIVKAAEVIGKNTPALKFPHTKSFN